MPLNASAVSSFPLSGPVKTKSRCKNQVLQTSSSPVKVSTRNQFCDQRSGSIKLALSVPPGLVNQLHPIYGRKHSNIERSGASIACAAALNARCSASGQTQNLTREVPTSTKAPVRDPTKTPKLDDGGAGLPPRGDGGGGGGGGGGGENFSGGFFLLGVLGFLRFLKDIESDYQDRRGR